MQQNADKTTAALNEHVPSSDCPVVSAMRYTLQSGGKRVRPFITMQFAAMTGMDEAVALPLACAIEMVHTYSLIHDDLPSMDDDDMRRGLPSCHIKFGEATAILAGDALLTKAFEVAASADLPAESIVRAVQILAENSGIAGMIGGQQLDIAAEARGGGYTLEELEHINRGKTGGLMRTAALLGCVEVNDTPPVGGVARSAGVVLDLAADFAINFGHAFQIVDDILDYEEAIAAKVAPERKNYATIFGVDSARELARDKTAKAIECLKDFAKNEFLIAMAEYNLNRVI